MAMKPMKIKYPSNEYAWATYLDINGQPKYLVTSKSEMERNPYFLYAVSAEGACKRLGKSSSPQELAEKFIDEKLLREKKT